MPTAWTDTSVPGVAHPLSTLAEAHGLATALEALVASREAALTVVLPRSLHARVRAFLADHAVEAGGLLLGRCHAVAGVGAAPIVAIERFVPGRVSQASATSLALGTALWDDARPFLDAGLAVIGWVHSHPDLGAFFSGTDRRTQRAFFAAPWQVGWCIDPVRDEAAWFRGPESIAAGLRIVSA